MAGVQLSIEEKIKIVKLIGNGERSARVLAQEFNNTYPGRNITHASVLRVKKLFEETGSVSRRKTDGGRIRIRHSDNVILEYFNENPHTSIRGASLNLHIDKSCIWRCLKRHNVKAFKPQFLHTLEDGDYEKRIEYCLWLQGNFLDNGNFLKNILYSDEATFTTNGTVSSQNSRFWSVENPNFTINCKRQYSYKVNVWCGILNERIIGPYFFRQNLTGNRYLQFLENEFWGELHALPLDQRVTLRYQLDGSPVHNAAAVRYWLNQHFPNKWIGRNSPLIGWPPRSPDLTPLDFFLWGTLKNEVYKHRPTTRDQLCDRIRIACDAITPQHLRKVVLNNRRRVEKCLRVNGGLIEDTSI